VSIDRRDNLEDAEECNNDWNCFGFVGVSLGGGWDMDTTLSSIALESDWD